MIATHFNRDEMDYLVFAVGVEPDDVRGQNLKTRAAQFVRLCNRKSIIPELLRVCAEERKNVSWTVISQGGGTNEQ